MKIIIVNYRYFVSGGPERYLFNVIALLEEKGHTVIPFSIKSKLNQPSKYEKYFLSPIGDGSEVYFKEYKKKNLKTVIKAFTRMFYSFEAKQKLNKLIKDVKPDLVYVLHYQNKISASIFDATVKNRVPVVHRMSDFGHICANALLFRPKQKDVCERCLNGSKVNAIINKCVYDSYIYSTVKVASLQLQKFLHVERKIDAIVVPSTFTISKLKEYGYPLKKMNYIPTFFNFQTIKTNLNISYENYGLYIGRIEEEKGLMTLVKAFENTNYHLKIIGASSTGYDKVLKDYLADRKHNIEFTGKLDFDVIQDYLCNCAFTVVPSEWYDNFPNSVLESYAFKKCVIATDLGSLKGMVQDKKTGLLFPFRSSSELKKKVEYLLNNKEACIALGLGGYNKLKNEFSQESHYQTLISLFENTIKTYK